MRKALIIIVLAIFNFFVSSSQGLNDKILNIISKNEKIQNIQVNGLILDKFSGLKASDYDNSGIEIINNKGAVWVTINGSFKVFKMLEDGILARKDKSNFQGYNFGATNFLYNDTLFSIGGYGFWQTNGSVRFYSETTQEWDIIRGISDISYANGINGISYFDKQNSKVFVIFIKSQPEYVKRTDLDDEQNIYVQCFNLIEKKWWEESKRLNPKIADRFSEISLIQNFNHKTLINSNKLGNLLLDFNNNKIELVDEKFNTSFIQLKNKLKNNLTYAIGDSINIYDFINDTSYALIINPNQKTAIKDAVYINFNKTNYEVFNNQIIYSVLIFIVIACIVSFLIFTKRSNQKLQPKALMIDENVKDSSLKSIKLFFNNLTEIEKATLELIVKDNLLGSKSSITQINKTLGIAKKSIKIQNNIRGEAIKLINEKFKSFFSISEDLINRERADFDKRQMEYVINSKYLKKISSIF